MKTEYVERNTGEVVEEKAPGIKLINWLYCSGSGKFALETVVKKKFMSVIYGKLQDLKSSRRKIASFVEDMNIDMSDYEFEDIDSYATFNEFFYRKIKEEKRRIEPDRDALISPCDGKMLAYENIDSRTVVQIKGSTFDLSSLLADDSLAREYDGGTFLVIRLAPCDYHRFHFPDNCSIEYSRKIDGYYYSVNPVALKSIASLYCQNKRELSVLDTENFGKTLFLEVGATFVGSIVQTYGKEIRFKKGQEKGYFKFGGSTVAMIFKKGAVKIDDDIKSNTASGLETKIHFGEKIGKKRIDSI